jgi:hypothetical protein
LKSREFTDGAYAVRDALGGAEERLEEWLEDEHGMAKVIAQRIDELVNC